ncbi:hypothetical protein P8452_59203 [Trifolium repens]|nr:hypothetical protein P8452_59203 [Trifolium repens]
MNTRFNFFLFKEESKKSSLTNAEQSCSPSPIHHSSQLQASNERRAIERNYFLLFASQLLRMCLNVQTIGGADKNSLAQVAMLPTAFEVIRQAEEVLEDWIRIKCKIDIPSQPTSQNTS